MRIALVHNHYDKSHLEAVKKEMVKKGAPVIHAVWMECFGHWQALEGCHRLRAAKELGLTPEIEEVEYCESTMLSDVVVYDGGEDYTIAEICDGGANVDIIEFDYN